MKALLLTAPGTLAVADIDVPAPGPDEIRIRVAACGICGSDVHGFTGATGRRIPPLVMGHEAAGVVDAVGGDVRDLAAGDRVALDSTVFCGALASTAGPTGRISARTARCSACRAARTGDMAASRSMRSCLAASRIGSRTA